MTDRSSNKDDHYAGLLNAGGGLQDQQSNPAINNFDDGYQAQQPLEGVYTEPDKIGGHAKDQNFLENIHQLDEEALQHQNTDFIYLVWEPENFFQKIFAWFQNTLEVQFIFFMTVVALLYPSAVSLAFLIASLTLNLSQTQSQRWRFSMGLALMSLYFAGLVSVAITKLVLLEGMQTNIKDQDQFRRLIKYYQFLGFKLTFNYDYLNMSSDKQLEYTFVPKKEESFYTEFYLFGLIVFYAAFMYRRHKAIKFLLDKDQQGKIEQLKDILEERKSRRKRKILAATISEVVVATSTQLKNEKAAIEKERVLYSELSKVVRRSYVDSIYFSKQDQKFFVLVLVSQLFAAMTHNSVSDLPALLFITVMFAFYAVRRHYSIAYRSYCFFVVNFICFTMILKITYEVVVSIPYLEKWMSSPENKDETVLKFFNIVFGKRSQHKTSSSEKLTNLMSGYVCLLSCLCWKCAKWIEVVRKTNHLDNPFFFTRYVHYFGTRLREDAVTLTAEIAIAGSRRNAEGLDETGQEDVRAAKVAKAQIEELLQGEGTSKKKSRTASSSRGALRKAFNTMSESVPFVILWLARVGMFTISYTYTSFPGLLHLLWVILSFILPEEWTYFFSIIVAVPLLSFEFLVIYCSKIPVIGEAEYFGRFKGELAFEMKRPVLEQALMYLTLVVFYAMNSALIIKRRMPKDNSLIVFFSKRVSGEGSSGIWRGLLYLVEWVHIPILAAFWAYGDRVDTVDPVGAAGPDGVAMALEGVEPGPRAPLKTLCYFLFLTVYAAYGQMYRKTSLLLVLFAARSILWAYVALLAAIKDPQTLQVLNRLGWADGLAAALLRDEARYDVVEPLLNTDSSGLYYRFKPHAFDWTALLVLNALQHVNRMYSHKKEIAKLYEQCADSFKDKNQKLSYYLGRVKFLALGVLIYVALVAMVALQARLSLGAVNFVFFVSNILNLVALARGPQTLKAIGRIVWLARFVKLYALVVLVAVFLIASMPAQTPAEKGGKAGTASKPSGLSGFAWLGELLGAAPVVAGDSPAAAEARFRARAAVSGQLTTYTAFLFLSLYVAWYFEGEQQLLKGEMSFTERHYKRLFEFKAESKGSAADVDVNDFENSVYRKKRVYSDRDLVRFYEQTRFTVPFMVYRAMNYWPIADFLATYGHLVTNATIIYTALNLNVNCFMFLNVACTVYFYAWAAIKLNSRAVLNRKTSGLQTQCDIPMAQLITERHKTESAYEFLKLRTRVWRAQLTLLIFVICLSYPSPQFDALRDKKAAEAAAAPGTPQGVKATGVVHSLDRLQFWLFLTGLYKHTDPERGFNSGLATLALIVGLFIERRAINWLQNRNGCNHYKLQKFLELDMRREALRHKWEICPPVYDPERYRQHYFRGDFNELKEKMLFDRELHGEKSKESPGEAALGDFVPFETACRMRDTIKFSLLLDCHAPSYEKQNYQLDAVAAEVLHSVSANDWKTDSHVSTFRVNFSLDAQAIQVQEGQYVEVHGFVDKGYALKREPGKPLNIEQLYQEKTGPALVPRALWWAKALQPDQCKLGALERETVSLLNQTVDEWYLEAVIPRDGAGLNAVKELICEADSDEHATLVYKYAVVDSKTKTRVWERGSDRQLDLRLEQMDVDDVWEAGRQNKFTKSDPAASKYLYDYESLAVCQTFKIQQLAKDLKAAVDFKYGISFQKGLMVVVESLVLLVLMASIVLKANFQSILYLTFVIRFAFKENKTGLLLKLNAYVALFFVLSYFAYLINLTANSSPAAFPAQLVGYPKNADNPQDLNIKYAVPVFFHYKAFRNLELASFLGIGLGPSQLGNLLLDFVLLYLITMYIYTFKNPVLARSMKKVFWQFPSPQDGEGMERLEPVVREQVRWLFNPRRLFDPKEGCTKYKRKESNYKEVKLTSAQINRAEAQYEFAQLYNEQSRHDLNYKLTNYVDLSYAAIWSDGNLKEQKRLIKANSSYYRLVKQGSVLVYLTSHIFTFFCVSMMAIIRQSVISLVYVLILIPRIKDCAEVLDQRVINFYRRQGELERDIEALKAELAGAGRSGGRLSASRKKELEQKLHEVQTELEELNSSREQLTNEQRMEEKAKVRRNSQWVMINVLQRSLLIWSLLDVSFSILRQSYLCDLSYNEAAVGGLKLWSQARLWTFGKGLEQLPGSLTYEKYINSEKKDVAELSWDALGAQLLICAVASGIIFQRGIFTSYGYQKFVSQSGGSMDLLMQLSSLKSKSITYIFNNSKITKIASLQRKRETIMATVERVKERLIKWRRYTRTMLTATVRNEKSVRLPEIQQLARRKDLQTDASPKKALTLNDQQSSTQKKARKTVRFAPEAVEQESIQEAQVAQQKETSHVPPLQRPKMSQDEMDRIVGLLAVQFLAAKKQKLRPCVKFYEWLNVTFTEQIMFRNNEKNLQSIKESLARGGTKVTTELEEIMLWEAKELISDYYGDLKGNRNLSLLLKKASATEGQRVDLLKITEIDKKIKLKQMPKTMEFVAPFSLTMRLLETLFHILISQTQNLVYLSMILSMYANAGLISLYYPLMIFGWGLIEESRPDKAFWDHLRRYTTFVLVVKILLNMEPLAEWAGRAEFAYYQSLLQLGLHTYKDVDQVVLHVLPEVMIICFIVLNEIKLKLLGLYYKREDDIETVFEGIQRFLEKGDEEKIESKKIQASNMFMHREYFSKAEQQATLAEWTRITKDEVAQELDKLNDKELEEKFKLVKREARSQGEDRRTARTNDQAFRDACKATEFEARFVSKRPPEDQQNRLLAEVSESIWKTSKEFDLEMEYNNGHLNILVEEKAIQKSLENDNLMFIEGFTMGTPKDMLGAEELGDERAKPKNWGYVSAGDFDEELDLKAEKVERRTRPRQGFFEKSKYFQKVFPSAALQKPGYDLYGASTFVLGLMLGYVLMFYQSYTVDPEVFEFVRGQGALLDGGQALTILAVIALLIVERLANRSDTKQSVKKANKIKGSNPDSQAKSFFSQNDMFLKTEAARSMAVKLRTSKTTDLDMQGAAAQQFLAQFDEAGPAQLSSDRTQTRVTVQQKGKFVLHWLILIAGHVYVFWFIPISGNLQLYNSPRCQQTDAASAAQPYPCRDFHENTWLRVLYLLLVLYLVLSALQIRYGFPTLKKPSSVLQYRNHWLPNLGAVIYMACPFALELRCLLDYTVSKTSLDLWQFYQLYGYHHDLYTAGNGNHWYTYKPLGLQTGLCDKCTLGVLLSAVVLTLMAGPFVLFSTFGGLVQPNPVLKGAVELSLLVNRTTWRDGSGEVVEPGSLSTLEQAGANYSRTISVKPYSVYRDDNLYFTAYTEAKWNASPQARMSETNFFTPDLVQGARGSRHSAEKWTISPGLYEALANQVRRAVNSTADLGAPSVSLRMELALQRELPAADKDVREVGLRELNFTEYDDCATGYQLRHLFDDTDCVINKNDRREVTILNAFDRDYVLGASKRVAAVKYERDRVSNYRRQKFDVRLVLNCSGRYGQWALETRPADYNNLSTAAVEIVDPATCQKPQNPSPSPEEAWKYIQERAKAKPTGRDGDWGPFSLVLFSVLVSSSFLSAYSPTTFYTGVAFVLATVLRSALIMPGWTARQYEALDTDALIKVIEACYIYRHEVDLAGEEEAYRMLLEIIRTPELFKALCGSHLRGEADPVNDSLNPAQRKKLSQLNKMEQRGFDVNALKAKLLANKKK